MKTLKDTEKLEVDLNEDSDDYFFCAAHVNVNCESHVNYSMEIVICEEGSLNMVISGKEYVLNKGNAVFIAPFETHSFISVNSNKCRVIVFSPKYVKDFFEYIKHNVYENSSFVVSDSVLSFIKEIVSDDDFYGDKISNPAILWPLCYEIINKLNFTPGKKNFEDELLNALSFINQHYTEKINLTDVAKAVGIHAVTLSKKLNDHAKTSFNAYVNFKRCSLAAKLISNQGVSCSEAAFQAGFGSIRNFNRTFLSVYGITPTDYKNNPDISLFNYYH